MLKSQYTAIVGSAVAGLILLCLCACAALPGNPTDTASAPPRPPLSTPTDLAAPTDDPPADSSIDPSGDPAAGSPADPSTDPSADSSDEPSSDPSRAGENPDRHMEGNASVQDAERTLEIDVIGDVMMDSHIADYIRTYGAEYPWTDVAPILKQADLAVANLETSVSTRGATKKPEGFGFRSDPSTLQGLEFGSIDLVSLANNHSLDYGEDALVDTMKHLDDRGIRHAGAGKNLEEAEQMITMERNGLTIGFLSYTSIIPWKSWIAGKDSPGLAALTKESEERLLDNIGKSSDKCDLLIVLLHWGREYHDQPESWQRTFARQMVDHGADAVIGTHPHVLQGIELYKNKPILYSIGNFIFLKKDDHAGETAVFRLTFNREGFQQGTVLPVYIQYCKANLLKPDDPLSQNIMRNLTRLSEDMGTAISEDGQFAPASPSAARASADKFPAAAK